MSSKAYSRYKKFNRKEPKAVKSVNIDLSGELVDLGKCVAVCYESDKEGKLRHYEHKFKNARLLSNSNGNALLIVGSKISVTDWIRG